MNVLQSFKQINTFIFDMDGVLTDGSLLILENGLMARRMNIKDGYSLQLAIKKGYRIIILSGSSCPYVTLRLNKLGITEIFMDVPDKKQFLSKYVFSNQLDLNSILYMGDDIPDLPAMKMVFLPCCPNDAVSEIKEVASYISPVKGGSGCARDVIEKVLKLNNQWETDI